MIFKLESPFKELWLKAYIREAKDGRKRVDLVNSSKNRTTISYARYLVCVKENRLLDENEEVDHIDGDRTNDSIDNLQILDQDIHRLKSISERSPRQEVVLECYYCKISFKRFHNQTIKGYKNSFCSRSCSAKFYNFGR